jgi:uracil-DNA glycosylase family 4
VTAPDDASVRLERLRAQVIECRACPRLVAWRELVAVERTARFADQTYWGRPVPGFGDPHARLLIVGLAPAAHGANRTGRMFTGDRSGDFLFEALHRAGLANQPTSTSADDGLRLRDTWLTAVNRCAPPDNKPTPRERDACRPFLETEIAVLDQARVVVCLGGWSWDGTLRALAALGARAARKPAFTHGAEAQVGRWRLLGCYHPSQQNTFTGRLTPSMMDAVLARAMALALPDRTVTPPLA